MNPVDLALNSLLVTLPQRQRVSSRRPVQDQMERDHVGQSGHRQFAFGELTALVNLQSIRYSGHNEINLFDILSEHIWYGCRTP